MQIKNLKKVVLRIKKAIKNKEKIILYGDSDLDGITSTIILKEVINNFKGNITAIYFPDREKDGYGINKKALNYLKKYAPALLIALDCGIANFKEVKKAKMMGFEVIIIDHHEILDKLPDADIIVNPKQKGDKYPFKYFSTAGLAFKFAEVFFNNKMPESLRKNFLELAAMATIADIMPKIDENKKIINEGLSFLESSWRPGIQALLELEEFRGLDIIQKISKINSILNVRGIKDKMPLTFLILSSSSKEEAKKIAEKLMKESIKRKEKVKNIIDNIEKKMLNKKSFSFIFEGSSRWEMSVLGIVASYICNKYQKPVFLFKKGKSESCGTIRSVSGINVVEAMKGYAKKLITFGGHPQAAGFRIKNKYLNDFKKYLTKYFNRL